MNRMERISGPYMGYYIAAYSVEAARGHVGYAKVCAEEPVSVWAEGTVEKLAAVTGCTSEMEAVVAAEMKARRAIAELAGWPASMPGALS